MPRRKPDALPVLRRHQTKKADRAYLSLDGERIYCGAWGSEEAQETYDRIIAEWLANGRRMPTDADDLTIAELCEAYLTWAEEYYQQDKSKGQIDRVKAIIRVLMKLYGNTPAYEFGPKALRTVRASWIEHGYARSTINSMTTSCRHIFKWAAGRELLPGAIYQNLCMVEGLRRGRSRAIEPAKITPVPADHIAAVKAIVTKPVAAMIDFQLLTGARPGEVCGLRRGDIDRTGEIWIAKPSDHKTSYHGHERTIFIGPKLQSILKPFMLRNEDEYIFSPRESNAEAQERARGKGGPGRRPNQAKTRTKTERTIRECYSTASYGRAIARACKIAGVEHWTPHRLRHTAATLLRKEFGLEAAQVMLGHRNADVTQIYAELDLERGLKLAEKFG